MKSIFKRNKEIRLKSWFEGTKRNLYVTGPRGVGKTTFIKDFLDRNNGGNYIYINSENDRSIQMDLLSNRIMIDDCTINKGTVIIFDELHTKDLYDTAYETCLKTGSRCIFIESGSAAESDMFIEKAEFERIALAPLTFDEFLLFLFCFLFWFNNFSCRFFFFYLSNYLEDLENNFFDTTMRV